MDHEKEYLTTKLEQYKEVIEDLKFTLKSLNNCQNMDIETLCNLIKKI